MPPRAEAEHALWVRSLLGFANGVLRLPLALRVALTLGWMLLIWTLSSQQDVLPEGADSPLWGYFANLGHAPIFGLLAMWGGLCLLPRRAAGPAGEAALPPLVAWKRVALLGFVLAYGLLDEWHQSWVPGRDSTMKDLAIDGLGALNVLWIAGYLGSQGLSEAGLRQRLLLGVLSCVLATAILTEWS